MKAEEHEHTQQVMNPHTEFLTALGDWLTRKTVTPDSRYKVISKYASINKNLTDPWGLRVDLLWALKHKITEEMENIVYRFKDILDDTGYIDYDTPFEIEFSEQEEVAYLKAIGTLLVSKTTRDDIDDALDKMPYGEVEWVRKMDELSETVNTRLREIIFKLRYTNYE